MQAQMIIVSAQQRAELQQQTAAMEAKIIIADREVLGLHAALTRLGVSNHDLIQSFKYASLRTSVTASAGMDAAECMPAAAEMYNVVHGAVGFHWISGDQHAYSMPLAPCGQYSLRLTVCRLLVSSLLQGA